MKRILGLLLLAGVVMTPAVALADEQIGVYVTPKFIYGLTQMDSFKGHFSEDGDSYSQNGGSRTDDTFGASIAIGYDFEKKFDVPIRAELAYAGFSKAETQKTYGDDDYTSKMKQTFGIQTLVVNAYWDINTGTRFTPYLGAGLSMAFIKTKCKDSGYEYADPDDSWNDSTGSRNVTNFAWNVGAGLGYDITESWTLDIGYRFVGLGPVKTKTYSSFEDDFAMHGKTDNLYQHQFAVGARYTF